jgi:hypothetical protein
MKELDSVRSWKLSNVRQGQSSDGYRKEEEQPKSSSQSITVEKQLNLSSMNIIKGDLCQHLYLRWTAIELQWAYQIHLQYFIYIYTYHSLIIP